jgi:hypothetical protein
MSKASAFTKRLQTPPVVRHDLKCCPFCGASPEMQYWHGGKPTKKMISCPGDNCDVRPMVTGETERETIERWERRA